MAKECEADDEHEGDGAEFSDISTPRDMAAASPQTRKEALKLIKSKGAPPCLALAPPPPRSLIKSKGAPPCLVLAPPSSPLPRPNAPGFPERETLLLCGRAMGRAALARLVLTPLFWQHGARGAH